MLKKYMGLYLLALVLLIAVLLKMFGTEIPRMTQETAKITTEEKSVENIAPDDEAQDDYFESFRRERESIRRQEMQYLDEVIATGNIDAQTLDQALEQKMALVENMEKEFTIESMISAKGFKDAAVTFHSDSVNVVVGAQTLSSAEVAQILDIVRRETGASAQNIKITADGTGG